MDDRASSENFRDDSTQGLDFTELLGYPNAGEVTEKMMGQRSPKVGQDVDTLKSDAFPLFS